MEKNKGAGVGQWDIWWWFDSEVSGFEKKIQVLFCLFRREVEDGEGYYILFHFYFKNIKKKFYFN
jgi:hypothetical protein